MRIRFNDGHTTDALLLSRTENSIRVVIPGAPDTAVFHQIHGHWVSEGSEPVDIEFAWSQIEEKPLPKLDECVCPPKLAAELLQMLAEGEEWAEAETEVAAPLRLSAAAGLSGWAASSIQ